MSFARRGAAAERDGSLAAERAQWTMPAPARSFLLNVWDVGGQRSLRSYWRNYFEATDGLVWVVDSADVHSLPDCAKELHALLREEARPSAAMPPVRAGLTARRLLHRSRGSAWQAHRCSSWPTSRTCGARSHSTPSAR